MTVSPHLAPLPAPRTQFFGRTREIALAAEALRTRRTRLLTLTGPGGVGKTRLALRVAEEVYEEYAQGVLFVPLTAAHDPTQALSTLVQELDIQGDETLAPDERIARFLQEREMLLVLDNLEQILTIGENLGQILAICPALSIMTTSRISLHIPGEQTLPISPFPVPDTRQRPGGDLAKLKDEEAVALVLDRAVSAVPSFALTTANAQNIITICHQCDGLPLALELAAARLRILSPGELAARLDERLHFLAGGSRDLPERLQAMRHAIAWSYDLLAPPQQALFRWLSAFSGGFGIDAVEQMVSLLSGETAAVAVDLVADLVDASLFQRTSGPDALARFTMLETIREFGLEQLIAAGEEEAVRDAHAAWCIAFAEMAGSRLAGPDHFAWWQRINTELGNIRNAHAWLFARHDAERALRLGAALTWFWSSAEHFGEGRALYRQLIDMSAAGQWPALLGEALSAAGNHEHWLDNYAEAETLYLRRLALCQASGDVAGIVSTLRALGSVAIDRNDLDAASHFLAEGLALSRDAGSAWDRAAMANLQGIVAFARGHYAVAADRGLEAIQGWAALEDTGHVAAARANQARAVLKTGDCRRAAELLVGVLDVLEADVGDDMVTCDCLEVAAGIAFASRDLERCARQLAAADAMLMRLGVSRRPCFRDFVDHLVAHTRATLGETAFAVSWQAGSALSVQDSIGMAFAVTTSARLAPPAVQAPPSGLSGLSAREQEVLRLVARGHSDKEIAAALGIARFTASNHVSNIRAKLDLPSRAAVAAVAARDGLT